METRNWNAGLWGVGLLALALVSGQAAAGTPGSAVSGKLETVLVTSGQPPQEAAEPLRLALLDTSSPAGGATENAVAEPEQASVPPALWVAAIAVLGLVSVGRRHSGDS